MKKVLLPALASMLVASTLSAFDAEYAAKAHGFFKNFTQSACANTKLFVDSDTVLKMLREDKTFTLLDIRSKGETGVVALTLENALAIPLNELFEAKNLERLPSDRPIIIVCHSGTRATMAATHLAMAGIKNVQVLVGGISALALANTPATAPLK